MELSLSKGWVLGNWITKEKRHSEEERTGAGLRLRGGSGSGTLESDLTLHRPSQGVDSCAGKLFPIENLPLLYLLVIVCVVVSHLEFFKKQNTTLRKKGRIVGRKKTLLLGGFSPHVCKQPIDRYTCWIHTLMGVCQRIIHFCNDLWF